MTFSEVALQMYPFWFLGVAIIFLTLRSPYADLLRVSPKPVIKWLVFLTIIAALRYCIFVYAPGIQPVKTDFETMLWIPWQMTLTVFWEDAAYILPLLLLQRILPSKWLKPLHFVLMLFMMLAFGIGHLYQGNISAIILSFYIPFAIRMARKHGLGTIMVCHVLYDLSTILLIQYVVRTLS